MIRIFHNNKKYVLWYVASCFLKDFLRCFQGTYYLHLQDYTLNQASKEVVSFSYASTVKT
jgi:hypothetical protein